MARSKRLTLHQIYSDDVPPLADSTWQQLPKPKHKSQRQLKAKAHNAIEVFRGKHAGLMEERPVRAVPMSQIENPTIPSVQTIDHPVVPSPTPVATLRATRLPTIRTLLSKVGETHPITTAQSVFDMCSFYNKPYSLVSEFKGYIPGNQQLSRSQFKSVFEAQHCIAEQTYPSEDVKKVAIESLLNSEGEISPIDHALTYLREATDIVCESFGAQYDPPNNYEQSYRSDSAQSNTQRRQLPVSHHHHRTTARETRHPDAVFDAMDLLHCEKPLYLH